MPIMVNEVYENIGNIVFAFEIIGTIAFAVSGAVLGIEKKMDIFGVVILGLTTGVGGGIIRDLIVGVNPPMTFRNPVYLMVSIITSLVVFFPPVRKRIFRSNMFYAQLMLLMDSIGLGVFTITGIEAGYNATTIHGIFLLTFLGVITGVGGGVLRDVMAGDRPYIFVKHFYASASLIGAVICILMWDRFGHALAMIVGTAVVVLLRLLAARYRWSLPKADM